MMLEFPGVGQNFPKLKEIAPLSFQKYLRNHDQENYETVHIFYLENLTKPLYFRLKQNHSKIFRHSSLDIQLKRLYIYIHKFIVLKAVVH